MIAKRSRLLWAFVALGCVACGGLVEKPTPPPHRPPPSAPAARLVQPRPCHSVHGFTCAVLPVPVDYAGQASGTLRLSVGMQPSGHASRGVLLFLTGGPGQPGVPFLPHVQTHLGSALAGYRLVMFDQRGTGAAALRCPALQAAAGASDLIVPPTGSVESCARTIGTARRFYTTPETVADVEQLRRALGVSRLTLDGVSYGSYVAERYALTYPRRVNRLILDSVVPQTGADAGYLATYGATARVLRDLCAREHCGWDPAADVQKVVRTERNGPKLLDVLVAESVGASTFPGMLAALHEAASGHPARLNRTLAVVQRVEAAPAGVLSQGLHESTLCLDLAAPWHPAAPEPRRAADLTRELARAQATQLFPFDRATGAGNGLAVGCLRWPPTRPPDVPDGNAAAKLPAVPVLLLAGERDLSTPLAWARQEAAVAPRGRLVIIPDRGHSVQSRPENTPARGIVARFLGAR